MNPYRKLSPIHAIAEFIFGVIFLCVITIALIMVPYVFEPEVVRVAEVGR